MNCNLLPDLAAAELLLSRPRKPALLFLSPTLPAPIGHGSAIRADLQIEVLSERFEVFLLVFHFYKEIRFRLELTDLNRRCSSVTVLPRTASPEQIGRALCELSQKAFDVVHVFRLQMAPFAFQVIGQMKNTPLLTLDLDDFESKKAMRFASHFEAIGDEDKADLSRQNALGIEKIELEFLPRFNRIYISNPADREEIIARSGNRAVSVVPNAVRVPDVTKSAHRDDGTASLIFVGAMQYYPNEDAVLYFCDEILPLIRCRTQKSVSLTIVGTRPSDRVLKLCGHLGVGVTSDVASVAEYYNVADIAVVPLRIGGGTRIKILEACSFQVPVVSTELGAEGLNVVCGRELLIGANPKKFAGHCVRLIEDQELAMRIGLSGHNWVRAWHTVHNIRLAFGSLALF